MRGYEDMSEFFEGEGLGIPLVREDIQPEVREIRHWTYAMFNVEDAFRLRDGQASLANVEPLSRTHF